MRFRLGQVYRDRIKSSGFGMVETTAAFYSRVMEKMIDKTLVIGASGRVGRLLARAWAQAGQGPCLQHRGTALDWSGTQLEWQPLSGTPLPQGYAAMILLATARDDLSLNARLTETCLAAAKSAGIVTILLASSSAVYGTNAGRPCAEDTATNPVNAYGEAKLAVEAIAAHYRDTGMAITALRIGNVAGADALLTNPARPLLIDRFASGQGPLRSYIGPQCMARLLADLLEIPLPPVLNLASTPTRMQDLAEAAALPWRYQAAPDTAHESITLDCSRLANLLPLPAQTAAEIAAEWRACQ
jgi:UDP-glucose 4-epimerase